jgi:hypothetical protein
MQVRIMSYGIGSRLFETKKSLYITMITTYGIKQNIYSGDVQSEVKGEDLFER